MTIPAEIPQKDELHIVVATHGHCFDGMCSAALFSRLATRIYAGKKLRFTYRGAGYGPGQNGVDPAALDGDLNAILDYRFSTSPKLSWYFDHHVSAFPTPAEKALYEAKSHDRARTMFHDGTYGSCTKLIADVGAKDFDLDPAPTKKLVEWADMIDSANFPTAKMAVDREEPVLQLMTVVEHQGDDAFLAKMVPRLLSEPIEDVARAADVQAEYAPLAKGHRAFVELVAKKAEDLGAVVYVDLTSDVIDVAGKFVTYALYPKSAYSVMVTRSKTKCKISIGYNPWSNVPRVHNIAAICERYGGGGHPVVGAISKSVDEVASTLQIARDVARELAS